MFNYLRVDIKVLFRIPLSVFFTLGYPIMMMFIIVGSYGNVEIGNGLHLIDKYFLITIGMGLLPLTLISFPTWIASSIEDNSLKRMQYFRVPFFTIVSSAVLAHFLVALAGMALNIGVAKVLFNLTFPTMGHFIAFIMQYIIAIIIYMLEGSVIALILKRSDLVMPCGLVLMFGMYMFCGAFITYDELPMSIKIISKYLPMKYMMIDSFDIWSNSSYFIGKYLILSLIYIIVLIILLIGIYRKSYQR